MNHMTNQNPNILPESVIKQLFESQLFHYEFEGKEKYQSLSFMSAMEFFYRNIRETIQNNPEYTFNECIDAFTNNRKHPKFLKDARVLIAGFEQEASEQQSEIFLNECKKTMN